MLYGEGIQHLGNKWVKLNKRQFYVKQNDRFCQHRSSGTQQSVGPRGLVFLAWAWKIEGCGEALTVISQIEPSLPGHVAAFAALFTAALFFTLHSYSPQQFGQKKQLIFGTSVDSSMSDGRNTQLSILSHNSEFQMMSVQPLFFF